LEFVLRGHGRLQHHAIKKQKPRTWRGFVSNLEARRMAGFFLFAPARPCALGRPRLRLSHARCVT
ncbi:hypothetical protein, partial [Burkholderia pseudomallei]